MTPDDTDTSATSAGSLCKRLHEMPDDQLHNYDARIAFYLGAARAPATHRAYAADIAAFLSWGGAVPTTPQAVAAYLASSDNLAVSTLRRRLAAIADAHQAGGYADPTKHTLVRKVFRGICRTRGAGTTASMPLDASMLASLIAAIPGDLEGTRDRALLLVGFFCALRRSELVGLQVDDVVPLADGWTVKIRRSKTDQEAVGHRVALPSFSGVMCPTNALRHWLGDSGIATGPIFRTINTERTLTAVTLPSQAVGIILRSRAAAVGLDNSRLSAHSLRSGFSVSAVRAGVSLPLIQSVTRHATLSGLEPYVRMVGTPTAVQMAGLIGHEFSGKEDGDLAAPDNWKVRCKRNLKDFVAPGRLPSNRSAQMCAPFEASTSCSVMRSRLAALLAAILAADVVG